MIQKLESLRTILTKVQVFFFSRLDLQIFSLTLSQLSYMGVHWRKLCVVHPFFFFVATTKTKVRRLRLPGIEPGSNAWEASMITITLQALTILQAGIEPATPGS